MAEKIKITFLGTSDSIPTSDRNHTSILLNYKEEHILVDCGEGTQRQFRKANLNPCKITRLLITHWHGDHVLGIPGMLQTLALSGYNKTLMVYGPKGTKKFMNAIFNTFIFVEKFPIKVFEIDKNRKFIDTPEFYIESEKMTHGVPCNAYAFVRKEQIRINKEKLKKSELPSSPLLKKLKDGKDILYNGKKYLAKDFTFKEHDKKISFVLDTSMNKKIVPFVKNSDLLICESTFSSEFDDRAKEYNHLTSKQAAQIAKKAKAKKLILTHTSQRYKKDMKKLLYEAKKVFKNSVLVRDFESFIV